MFKLKRNMGTMDRLARTLAGSTLLVIGPGADRHDVQYHTQRHGDGGAAIRRILLLLPLRSHRFQYLR